MEYLVRFSQTYETFRLPEIQALAIIEGVPLEVVSYSPEVSTLISPRSQLSTNIPNTGPLLHRQTPLPIRRPASNPAFHPRPVDP